MTVMVGLGQVWTGHSLDHQIYRRHHSLVLVQLEICGEAATPSSGFQGTQTTWLNKFVKIHIKYQLQKLLETSLIVVEKPAHLMIPYKTAQSLGTHCKTLHTERVAGKYVHTSI